LRQLLGLTSFIQVPEYPGKVHAHTLLIQLGQCSHCVTLVQVEGLNTNSPICSHSVTLVQVEGLNTNSPICFFIQQHLEPSRIHFSIIWCLLLRPCALQGPGFTLSVYPNNCWSDVKWFPVLFWQIQLMFIYMHSH